MVGRPEVGCTPRAPSLFLAIGRAACFLLSGSWESEQAEGTERKQTTTAGAHLGPVKKQKVWPPNVASLAHAFVDADRARAEIDHVEKAACHDEVLVEIDHILSISCRQMHAKSGAEAEQGEGGRGPTDLVAD